MKKNTLGIMTIVFSIICSFVALAGQMIDDGTGNKKYLDDDGYYIVQDDRWIDIDGDGTFLCYYFDSNGNLKTSGSTESGGMVNSTGAYLTPRDYQVNTWKPLDEEEIYSKWVGEYENNHFDPTIKISVQKADADGIQLVYSKKINGVWNDVSYSLYFSEDKMAAFYTLYDTMGNIIQHEAFRLTNGFDLQTTIDETDGRMIQFREFKRIK